MMVTTAIRDEDVLASVIFDEPVSSSMAPLSFDDSLLEPIKFDEMLLDDVQPNPSTEFPLLDTGLNERHFDEEYPYDLEMNISAPQEKKKKRKPKSSNPTVVSPKGNKTKTSTKRVSKPLKPDPTLPEHVPGVLHASTSSGRKRSESYSSKSNSALVTKRCKSEDWDSKHPSSEYVLSNNRIKWSEDEMRMLWKMISIHGNEWRQVQKPLKGRSYHQVKDKGRRLLQQQLWKTGRTKIAADDAYKAAKSIALQVLETYN